MATTHQSRRVLVLGTGGIGKRHLRGLTETGRALISVVEPNADRRAEAAAEFELEEVHGDLGTVDLTGFDLATICTPAHIHVEMMARCADAGLPFLVEKPLAVTLDGVDDVLARVRGRNLLARVGYIRRIAPEVLSAREQIRAGRIGALKLAYVNASQEFPKYRPDFRTTYYARPEMGGGAILDAASHSIDLLIWLMGRPVTVGAMHDRLVLEGTETEDTCLINIRFESGAMANITINQFQKRNISSSEFIGTAGNLMIEHSTVKFADSDAASWAESHDHMDGLAPTAAHQARFTLQANTMLDALDGRPDTLATLEDARQNLDVALAAKRSWAEHRFITLGA